MKLPVTAATNLAHSGARTHHFHTPEKMLKPNEPFEVLCAKSDSHLSSVELPGLPNLLDTFCSADGLLQKQDKLGLLGHA